MGKAMCKVHWGSSKGQGLKQARGGHWNLGILMAYQARQAYQAYQAC